MFLLLKRIPFLRAFLRRLGVGRTIYRTKRLIEEMKTPPEHRKKLQRRILSIPDKELIQNRDAYVNTVLKDRKPLKLRDAKVVVITVTASEPSVKSAKKCIKSAADFGHKVEIFSAYSPKDDPLKLMRDNNFRMNKVVLTELDRWSRLQCVAGLFLSNYEIWRRCAEEGDKPYLILEHDAVFINPLPDIEVLTVVNLGVPHRTFYKQPLSERGLREFPFRNLQGTHAYAIHPAEAQKALADAPRQWHHTDLFFSKLRVPLIQDYVPHPIVSDDRFTTMARPDLPSDIYISPGYQKNKRNYKFIDVD